MHDCRGVGVAARCVSARRSKLRSWYESMLKRAQEAGIVREFGDIQEEIVDHLTSIRDLPMFEGDFFPEHVLRQVLPEGEAGSSNG